MKHSTVRQILLSSLLMLVLFTGVVSVAIFGYTRDSLVQASSREARNALTKVSQQADAAVYTMNQSAKLLASRLSTMNTFQYPDYSAYYSEDEKMLIVSALNDFIFLNENVDAAFLFDNYGRIFGTRYYESVYDLDHIRETLDESPNAMLWFADPDRERLVLGKYIYSTTLRRIGMLLIAVRSDIWADIFRWPQEDFSPETIVFDRPGGTVLYSTLSLSDEALRQLAEPDSTAGASGFQACRLGDKAYQMYTYTDGDKLQYIYLVPEAYFTQGIGRVIGIILLVIAGYIVIGGVLILNFQRRVNRPLQLINLNLKQFTIKGSTIPIRFAHNDEFKELYDNFLGMSRRINALVETTYEQQLLNKELELSVLQAQIDPHFINNTFEIINSMALNGESNKIGAMTKALSNIMRYTIDNRQREVTLRQELDNAANYLRIQQERFMGNLRYLQDVPAELLEHRLPKLTLQPILENCIVHGFEGRWKDCLITLSARRTAQGLRIDITDNGCGMTREEMAGLFQEKAHSRGNGVALMNISRRLQIQYGPGSGLSAESTPGQGTTISILLVENG